MIFIIFSVVNYTFMIVFGSLIIFSIAGYFETRDSHGEMSEMIAYSHEHNIQTNLSSVANDKSGLEYFIHNFIVDIMTIILNTPPIIHVLSSSSVAGYFIGKDFLFGAVSTLPHGIIEYLGSVFALTIASIITRIKDLQFFIPI